MPNLAAAKKAQRSSKNKTAYNKKVKDRMSRITKKTLKLIELGDVTLARQQLPKAYKALDKAAENGVLHPNASARKKSRLEKKLNSAAQHVKTAQKNP